MFGIFSLPSQHLNGNFSEKCLKELPWSIRDSVSLYEVMTASFNGLTEIPVELPLRLPHLSNLDLSHNRLHFLPESFGLLFHLREVHLQHNRLSSLPGSFVHLVKLEQVKLCTNFCVFFFFFSICLQKAICCVVSQLCAFWHSTSSFSVVHFFGLGLPSHCDPFTLGQTTVCLQGHHWEAV